MLNRLITLFSPQVRVVVRHIGSTTDWSCKKHPHNATSSRTIRCRRIYRVGELVEVAEGVTLIVREVTHIWNSPIQVELVLDFADPFPKCGYEMKQLGFNFYNHNGSTSLVRSTQQNKLAVD
jgi:hypothetical protein